jgi:hypothetical protein
MAKGLINKRMKFPKTFKSQDGKYGTPKKTEMASTESKIYYTTAEEAYDGFGTKTIEQTNWTDDRGRQVRKVEIPNKANDWQINRYRSGNRGAFTEDEFEKYKGVIFLEKTPEKEQIWVTNAEKQYDDFGTKTIEETNWVHENGRVFRKVLIPSKYLDLQMKLYRGTKSETYSEQEFDRYKKALFKEKDMEKEKEFVEMAAKTEATKGPLDTITIQNAELKDNSYVPASDACVTVDTVSPASMRYDMFKAIETINRRVNGVDEYVAEKLGYFVGNCTLDQKKEGLKCLCDAFSAEQVDALAVAIYNIEEKRQGCIIGDQTGIGKGRIAAGMIRYAVKRGLQPIFLTEKPNLFSDLFRDIIAIGSDSAIPMEVLTGQKEVEKRITKKTTEGEDDEQDEQDENEDDVQVVKVDVYKKNPGYPNIYEFVQKNENGKDVLVTKKRTVSMVPYIVNGGGSKTAIKDEQGNILYKGLAPNENKNIIESINVPKDYQFILATYSQFRGATENAKMQFLMSVARGNVVIMDESHNASGASNVGAYLRKVLEATLGVTFLSATFAKRPDNMPIYAGKTAMADANMTSDDLVQAIISGGVALQEIVSSNLVAEGQMIRRERSFEGIEVNYEYLDKSQALRGFPNLDLEQTHRAVMDRATDIIREIMAFQRDFVNPEIEAMDKIAKAEYKQVDKRKGTSGAGVDNPPIFSGVFNVINQLLFSIKAESVADVAIERLKQGKKPVIAFANTMESFLDTMTNDDGTPVSEGDVISGDFSKIFEKRLNGVLRYTVKDAEGNAKAETLDVAEMSPEFRVEYKRILQKIKTASLGIGSSPIDVVVNRIEKAGYSCVEVTGRSRQLKILSGGKAQIKSRVKVAANDAFRQFNNNEVDCLLINQSGSTGASAHALPNAKTPKEKVKQRVMIILQAELNINTEVQKRGRINRTGQIHKPIYDYVISAIPAEKRLMMMLQKKLKSLDANTTSSQKQSEELMDVRQVDFLNKYGDQIVYDYLRENPLINLQIGDPLKMSDSKPDEMPDISDAAHRVSGRVAILSVKDQENFYNEIGQRYIAAVEYLRQSGEYDLEVESMNLQAETIEKEIVVVGKGGDSVFGRNSILEKVSVLNLKKPYNKQELDALIKESLGDNTAESLKKSIISKYEMFIEHRLMEEIKENEDHYNNLIENVAKEKGAKKLDDDDLRTYIRDRKEALEDARDEAISRIKTATQNKKEQIRRMFEFFTVGKVIAYPAVTYSVDGQYSKGVFLGFVIQDSVKNPYAPSALKLRFAIASSQRYIAVPASKYEVIDAVRSLTYGNIFSDEQEYVVENWDELIKEKTTERSVRYIVTGNILQAFGVPALKGNLVSYTTVSGGVKKGILLPETFTKERRGDKGQLRISVPIIKALPIIQGMVIGRSIMTNDNFSIIRGNEDYKILVPVAKNPYGKFYLDSVIMSLTKQGTFNKISGQMVANVELKKIDNLIQYLQDTFNCSVSLIQQEFDQIKDSIKDEDYNDEEKRPEETVIIEKLTEVDREGAELEAQKKFDEEQKAAQEENEKLESDKKLGEEFDLEKRKLAVKKKLINLIRVFNGEKVLMKRGGAVGVTPEILKAKALGAKAHNDEKMRVAAYDKELMNLIGKQSKEPGSAVILLQAWTDGWDSQRSKQMKEKFPEMYKKMAKGGAVQYKNLSSMKPEIVNEPSNESSKINEVDLVKVGVHKFDGSKAIKSADDATSVLRQFWDEKTVNIHESFNVLLLDKANKAIGIYHHSKGGIDGTVADIEMVCAVAVKSLAKGVIVCHNHPSGNLKPSEQDISLTKNLKQALKLLTISLLDSIIIIPNKDEFYSLANEGQM